MNLWNFSNIVYFFCLVTFKTDVSCESDSVNHAEQLYMQLFKRRRAEQLAAIKSFKNNAYEKQAQIINLVAKKSFAVIENSRVMLEASDFIPGISRFPENENLRDSLSNILENTALFGEIVLRYPEICEKIFAENNDFAILFQWAIAFMNLNSNLLDPATLTLINLVSQELNYTERSPNYINPYKKVPKANGKPIPGIIPKKKKPKPIKKGPRMTLGEL